MRKYAKILLGISLVVAFSSASYADKWNKLTFSDDIALGIAELNQYCLLHDIKIEDVLWANGVNQDEIKPGDFVYLPANQVDMLSIWQNKGAWNPSASMKVEKTKPVEKVIQPEPKVQTVQTVKTEQKVDVARSGHVTKMEQTPDADIQAMLASFSKTKSSTLQDTPPAAVVESYVSASTATKTTNATLEDAPKVSEKPEKAVEVVKLPKTVEVSRKVETPQKVITATAKPDKILASNTNAKKSSTQKSDPIIILSPNGDPSLGPMRLVIVGNTVEVVRLPENAAPRRPSMTDLDHTFGTMPDYLPYYNMTAKPRKDNFFMISGLNGRMMWPVNGKVSSFFGPRGKRKHEGIDIPMPAGTSIRAAKNGVVSRTGNNSTPGFRGYGNFVLLDHGAGLQSFYAHCSSVAVVPGQRIMQGQIIGYVGSTGRSTANHLHFEVRVNNTKVDPIPYLGGNTQFASR